MRSRMEDRHGWKEQFSDGVLVKHAQCPGFSLQQHSREGQAAAAVIATSPQRPSSGQSMYRNIAMCKYIGTKVCQWLQGTKVAG